MKTNPPTPETRLHGLRHAQALLGALLCLWTLLAAAQTDPGPNLALRKPVIASGPVWGGLLEASLTDGDPATFCHPLADTGTTGFFFEVDLGATYRLDHILLRNRDNCCPERLSNYRIEVYADNGGDPGAQNWSGLIRPDGSNSGTSGVDTVTAKDSPTGLFAGRFVRVVNVGGAAYSPQLAELEVYGGLLPEIRRFTADTDVLPRGGNTFLRWEIARATTAGIAPGVGLVSSVSGSVLVQPAATTTYTLRATNENGVATATLTIGVDLSLAPPQITEFLADNQGGLSDEDGDSSDWIELLNPNTFSLPLAGFFLTDDPADPTQWPFPAAVIPPGGRRIVFASGKNRRDPAAELHANFRLSSKGAYLALVDRDGHRVLQQFPADYPTSKKFPAQVKNVSYGLGTNGVLGFLRPPTPGATNGFAYPGVVGDISVSRPRGFYDTNIVVELACDTPDAIVRYTLNNSLPTATQGSVYSAPITISKTTVLRVGAFKTGWAPAVPQTHTYLYLSNVIAAANMATTVTRNAVYGPQMRDGLLDIPSVSMTTSGTVNGSTEVPASLEWLRADGQPGFAENCGVRLYGGAFTDFPKKSFRLYFRADLGTSKLKYPIYDGFDRSLAPASEFNQLELRSGSHDMSQRGFYMSNVFTDDTLLEMGQLNPHGRFVHLYLNGVYWGMYHLRERWDAAMHQSYLGGGRGDYESINGNWNVGGWADPGVPYDGDGSVWAKIKSLRGNYAEVKPWLDVPQYIDYMLMWMFGGSEDEYRAVGPNLPGSGFKFYLNDADGWFCIPAYCAVGDRTGRGAPGRSAGDGPGSIFSMLFKEGHPDYRTLLADRIYKSFFNGGALTVQRNLDRLNRRADEVRRAFLAESARWGNLSPAEFAARRDYALKTWLPRRTDEALAQYRAAGFYPALDAPSLNQQGGVVPPGFQPQFTGPSRGTIWFTLDGSDPRLPGGAVSPAAQKFSISAPTETLIPAGARWRWYTDATGLGGSDIVVGNAAWSDTNWKHPAFKDAAWNEGPAQFGWGEGDEATVIPFGPDPNHKWVTCYFRRHFSVADLPSVTSLAIHLKRDDGAIVYLNGREAARSSIGFGTVNPTTLAANAADDGQVFNEIKIPVNMLAAGDNLIAVELHQAAIISADASFDLDLVITRAATVGGNLPPVARSAVLKSRALDGTTWSALNEAFFQVGPSPLDPADVAFTELNLNAASGPGDEFLELANLSNRAVNLRGARFTEGIHYTFATNRDTTLAPGQRVVFVKDLFRFQQKYGRDIPVAGIYSGSLNIAGDKVTLANPSSNTVATVTFQNAQPWPAAAFGSGYTLVLSHPELGLNNPAAWRASLAPAGTPGGSDAAAPFAGSPSEDADRDGLPALVEYAFGASDADPASGPGSVTTGVDIFGDLTITFPRNLRADDVTIKVETSTDLVTWIPAALLSTTTLSPGQAQETWGAPTAAAPATFLRLNVTRAKSP